MYFLFTKYSSLLSDFLCTKTVCHTSMRMGVGAGVFRAPILSSAATHVAAAPLAPLACHHAALRPAEQSVEIG